MHVCQVVEVMVTLLSSEAERRCCLPLTANMLLYVAELYASVKLHTVPLLPLLMPAVIHVAKDQSLLTRCVLVLTLA